MTGVYRKLNPDSNVTEYLERYGEKPLVWVACGDYILAGPIPNSSDLREGEAVVTGGYAEWYVEVDKIMLREKGLHTGEVDIPFFDYWDAGVEPDDVLDQAKRDGYL